MRCWRPNCAHRNRGRAGCRVPGSSGGCRQAPSASWCWSAGPPGSASRASWPTGRAATDRPVAWLSLDAGDNDPVRFWRHVTAALDGVQPGVAERVGPLVPGAAGTPFAGAVTALVNEFAAAARRGGAGDRRLPPRRVAGRAPVDGVPARPPAARAAPGAGQPQRPAAAARPAAGPRPARRAPRGRPALHRARRPRSCCAPRSGTHLPDPVVAALGERTEGWAAGLHLAALSLRGRGDVARFVAEFSGSHRFVLDYLTEEVLERQPERAADVPAGDLGPRPAVRPALRRGGRAPRRPAAAGVGRAGQPVPDPARRGAPVVALPPPLRRSAPRQPARPAPGPRARAAPRGGGPGTPSTACPTTPSGTRWPPATPPARPSSSRSTSRSRSGGAPRAPPSPPGSPRSRPRRSTAGRC